MSKFGNELAKHNKSNLQLAVRDTLDEESFKDFVEALSNPMVASSAIATTLKSLGVDVSENTIRRWRNGGWNV